MGLVYPEVSIWKKAGHSLGVDYKRKVSLKYLYYRASCVSVNPFATTLKTYTKVSWHVGVWLEKRIPSSSKWLIAGVPFCCRLQHICYVVNTTASNALSDMNVRTLHWLGRRCHHDSRMILGADNVSGLSHCNLKATTPITQQALVSPSIVVTHTGTFVHFHDTVPAFMLL